MDASLSAYEKAGLEGKDPRCVPIKMDSPLPVGHAIEAPAYTADAHEIWQFLIQRQLAILPGRACEEFITGLEHLQLPNNRIPSLSELSDTLYQATGWQVARTPGLLHEEDFFRLLSEKVFPSTDYIRGRHELDYTPAPDIFHDVFGHMPMITDPDFADYYQMYGLASLHAGGENRRKLERFHWFTVEFGMLYEQQVPRIYGNGILSSHQETFHALGDTVERRAFDPEAMAVQDYEVWHLQPILYVVDSLKTLKTEFKKWAQESLHLL